LYISGRKGYAGLEGPSSCNGSKRGSNKREKEEETGDESKGKRVSLKNSKKRPAHQHAAKTFGGSGIYTVGEEVCPCGGKLREVLSH